MIHKSKGIYLWYRNPRSAQNDTVAGKSHDNPKETPSQGLEFAIYQPNKSRNALTLKSMKGPIHSFNKSLLIS